MSDLHGTTNSAKGSTPVWVPPAMIALTVTSLLGLGLAWSGITHAKNVESALGIQGQALQQNANASDTLTQRLANAEAANAQLQDELDAMAKRLKMTQTEINTSSRQSDQIRDQYSKNLSDVQSQLAGKASSGDVSALGTSLGNDLHGVRSDLDATRNDLSNTRGEFGTLIAKNHDEIEELRALGQRDYLEFTIDGKGQRSRVGSLMVELRSTNTKKNQFTVDLYVDDLRLEKKNRSIDEPIYFYTRGSHTPMELVVNDVEKNKVAGYLSVPKHDVTAASAAVVIPN